MNRTYYGFIINKYVLITIINYLLTQITFYLDDIFKLI